MQTFTTRELRVVAAILDGLNKARATNARLGVPTTPDVFTARFPTGHVAVLRWTEGVQSPDPKRRRVLERCARHRDGYQIDLGTEADPTQAIPLQDPQQAKRPRNAAAAAAAVDTAAQHCEVVATPQTIKAMSPADRDALTDDLIAAGFTQQQAEAADVVLKDPDTGTTHIRVNVQDVGQEFARTIRRITDGRRPPGRQG